MLSQIESKLTSLVADTLAARTHLSVLRAPGPAPTLDEGRGAVLVSIAGVTPATSFVAAQASVIGVQSKRILPIQFSAQVEFFLKPESGPGLAAGRALLLDDVSLVSHAMAAPTFAAGAAFAPPAAPDPGFRVVSLLLGGGEIARDAANGTLSAALRYTGGGEIWPPGVSQPEGTIRSAQTVLVSLPLDVQVRPPVARAGQTVTILVRAPTGERLTQLQPRAAGPLQLAVTVLSDAPPAERGTITGGAAGIETGLRILPVTLPETSIPYQAPASGIARARVESIAIHLAAPDGARGIFLGAAPVRLEP